MFGKSKKKQAAAQPQNMQVSPEALALLQAMQAQQLQAQQLQAQQMQAQQMQAQQMQAQQMGMPQMGMPQQAPQMMPQMPAQMAPQMPAQSPQAMSDQDLVNELGGVPPQAAMPQAMPQTMAQPEMPVAPAPTTASPTQPAMGTPAMPDGFAFATTQPDMTAPTDDVPAKKKGKLSKDEKRQIAAQKKAEKERKAAEKKANIAEKAEEKKRAKRRKKLAKTRFSRARYLREANGNAIAGAILWAFMILAFIIGPFFLNTGVLIPQTNENMRIISESETLERSIVVNRPQIAAMAEKRVQRENQIQSFKGSFMPRASAQQILEDLAVELETAGLTVTPVNVSNIQLSATSIVGTAASFEVVGDYLDWLRVRNNFVRKQTAISIPTESVRIDEESGQMLITAQIILPSQP